MITSLGHPKRIKTPQESTATSPITFLSVSPCEKYLAALTAFSLCVYSNLRHRVLLAHNVRDSSNLDFGSHHSLLWSNDSKQLFVTTKPGKFVCIYTLTDDNGNVGSDSEFEEGTDEEDELLNSSSLLQDEYKMRPSTLELLTVLNLPVKVECITKSLDYLVLACSRQLCIFMICFADLRNLRSVVYLSEFETEDTAKAKQRRNSGKGVHGGFEASCGTGDVVGCRAGCNNKKGAYLYAFLTSAGSVLEHLSVRRERQSPAELWPEKEEIENEKGDLAAVYDTEQPDAFAGTRNKHAKNNRDKYSFPYNCHLHEPFCSAPTAASSVHTSFGHPPAYTLPQSNGTSPLSNNGILQVTLNEALDKVAVVLTSGAAVVLAWRFPFDDSRTHCSSSSSSASSSTSASSSPFFPSNDCGRMDACPPAADNAGCGGSSEESLPRPIGVIVRCCGTEAAEFNPRRSILALALKDGSVDLISVSPLSHHSCSVPLAKVNVVDTLGVSCTPRYFGGVQKIQWSKDGFAIAVGWKNGGIAVFSYSGQPLFAPFRSPEALSSPYNPAYGSQRSSFSCSSFSRRESCEPTKPLGGILSLCWASYDLALVACYRSTCDELTEFAIYRSASLGVAPSALDNSGSKSAGDANSRVLIGADRLLVCSSSPWAPFDVSWIHIPLPPAAYTIPNWPMRQASLSPTGEWLLATGTRGIAVYGLRQRRWRLFGNIQHELQLQTSNLPVGWYSSNIFFVCSRQPVDGVLSPPEFSAAAHEAEKKLNDEYLHKPRSVATATDSVGDESSSGWQGYRLCFFDVRNRLDLDDALVVYPNLYSRPLRSTILSPSEGMVPPMGGGKGREAFGGSFHQTSMNKKMTRIAIQRLMEGGDEWESGEAPKGVMPPLDQDAWMKERRRGGISPSSVLAIYDAKYTITAYRLVFMGDTEEGRQKGGRECKIFVLWRAHMSTCGWIEHPIEVRFAGNQRHLLVLHASGNLTAVTLKLRPLADEDEEDAKDADPSSSVPDCLYPYETPPLVRNVVSLWTGCTAQLTEFFPFPAPLVFPSSPDGCEKAIWRSGDYVVGVGNEVNTTHNYKQNSPVLRCADGSFPVLNDVQQAGIKAERNARVESGGNVYDSNISSKCEEEMSGEGSSTERIVSTSGRNVLCPCAGQRSSARVLGNSEVLADNVPYTRTYARGYDRDSYSNGEPFGNADSYRAVDLTEMEENSGKQVQPETAGASTAYIDPGCESTTADTREGHKHSSVSVSGLSTLPHSSSSSVLLTSMMTRSTGNIGNEKLWSNQESFAESSRGSNSSKLSLRSSDCDPWSTWTDEADCQVSYLPSVDTSFCEPSINRITYGYSPNALPQIVAHASSPPFICKDVQKTEKSWLRTKAKAQKGVMRNGGDTLSNGNEATKSANSHGNIHESKHENERKETVTVNAASDDNGIAHRENGSDPNVLEDGTWQNVRTHMGKMSAKNELKMFDIKKSDRRLSKDMEICAKKAVIHKKGGKKLSEEIRRITRLKNMRYETNEDLLDNVDCIKGGFYVWCQNTAGLVLLTLTRVASGSAADSPNSLDQGAGGGQQREEIPLRYRQALLILIEQKPHPVHIIGVLAEVGVVVACSPVHIFSESPTHPSCFLRLQMQPCFHPFVRKLLSFPCLPLSSSSYRAAPEMRKKQANRGTMLTGFDLAVRLSRHFEASPFFKHQTELVLHEILLDAIPIYTSYFKQLKQQIALLQRPALDNVQERLKYARADQMRQKTKHLSTQQNMSEAGDNVELSPSWSADLNNEYLPGKHNISCGSFGSVSASFVSPSASMEMQWEKGNNNAAGFSDTEHLNRVYNSRSNSVNADAFNAMSSNVHHHNHHLPSSTCPPAVTLHGKPLSHSRVLLNCAERKEVSVLSEGLEMLKCFDSYLPEILITGIRKTEPLTAPALVFPVSDLHPHTLFFNCLERGLLRTASLYLVVLQNIVGPLRVRAEYALPLIRTALKYGLTSLTRSIVHFFRALYVPTSKNFSMLLTVPGASQPMLALSPHSPALSNFSGASGNDNSAQNALSAINSFSTPRAQQSTSAFLSKLHIPRHSYPSISLSRNALQADAASAFSATALKNPNESRRSSFSSQALLDFFFTPTQSSIFVTPPLSTGAASAMYSNRDVFPFTPSSHLWRPVAIGSGGKASAPPVVAADSDGVDRLAAARIYLQYEECVSDTLVRCIRELQWIKLFHLTASLKLDLPAWLAPTGKTLSTIFVPFRNPPYTAHSSAVGDSNRAGAGGVAAPGSFAIFSSTSGGEKKDEQKRKLCLEEVVISFECQFQTAGRRVPLQSAQNSSNKNCAFSSSMLNDLPFFYQRSAALRNFLQPVGERDEREDQEEEEDDGDKSDSDEVNVEIWMYSDSILRYFLVVFLILRLHIVCLAIALASKDDEIIKALLVTQPELRQEIIQGLAKDKQTQEERRKSVAEAGGGVPSSSATPCYHYNTWVKRRLRKIIHQISSE